MSNDTLLSSVNEAKKHGMSYGKYIQSINTNNKNIKKLKRKVNTRKAKW